MTSLSEELNYVLNNMHQNSHNGTSIFDSGYGYKASDIEYSRATDNFNKSLDFNRTGVVNEGIIKTFPDNIYTGGVQDIKIKPETNFEKEQKLKKMFEIKFSDEAVNLYDEKAAPNIPINFEQDNKGFGPVSYESNIQNNQNYLDQTNYLDKLLRGGLEKSGSMTEGFEDIVPYQQNLSNINSLKISDNNMSNNTLGLMPIQKFDSSVINNNGNAFTHNNMVPYFRGRVKQNTDEFLVKTKLENFTGVFEFEKRGGQKKEVASMFKPEQDVGLINGSKSYDFRQYFKASNLRQGEKIAPEIRVRPGRLGDDNDDGISTDPSDMGDGFHPRLRIMPKDTDELRIRPKVSFNKPVLLGEKEKMRGVLGEYNKMRPDTYYENLDVDSRGNVKAGAVAKEVYRSEYLDKITNAQSYEGEYITGAHLTSGRNLPDSMNPNERSISRSNLETDGSRNVGNSTTNSMYQGATLSTKMKNIVLSENSRDITGKRTVVSAPVYGQKQYFKSNDYVAKTTLKAGTENATVSATISGGSMKHQSKFDDTARTTVKEITENKTNTLGISAKTGHQSKFDDAAKTTMKETTETKTNTLGISTKTGHQSKFDDKARTTTKQMTVDETRTLGISAKTQHQTKYDDIARTTAKQMTVTESRTSSGKSNVESAYVIDPEYKAKPTMKTIYEDDTRPMPVQKPIAETQVYDTYYTGSEIFDRKEKTLDVREPTKRAETILSGYDTIELSKDKRTLNPYAKNPNLFMGGQKQTPAAGKQFISNTKERKAVGSLQNEWINPDNLEPFRKNPYTQTLSAYATI